MITITRKLEFDYGHRVLGHEGKCKHIHGHRGVIEVSVTAPDLDNLGRVVDFSVVKSVLGTWLDDNWDHNVLLHDEDPLLDIPPASAIWGGKNPYLMPVDQNPTAENLARLFGKIAQGLLNEKYRLTVVGVRFWETPNCYADWRA